MVRSYQKGNNKDLDQYRHGTQQIDLIFIYSYSSREQKSSRVLKNTEQKTLSSGSTTRSHRHVGHTVLLEKPHDSASFCYLTTMAKAMVDKPPLLWDFASWSMPSRVEYMMPALTCLNNRFFKITYS